MIFLVVFFANVSKGRHFLHSNTMFCKGSNLLHHSALIKDLSCLGILIFSGLPTLGRFFMVLNLKNFLRTVKAAFFEHMICIALLCICVITELLCICIDL